MKKTKVVQLENDFIQGRVAKQEAVLREQRKKNRFLGMLLVLVVLLFILPTYNLVETYTNIHKNEQELQRLQKEYETLGEQEKEESAIVAKLKDDTYAAKYIRAKYQFSKDGETIYNIPGLLPK